MPNVEHVGESYVEYRVKTPMARFYWSAVTRASSLSGEGAPPVSSPTAIHSFVHFTFFLLTTSW